MKIFSLILQIFHLFLSILCPLIPILTNKYDKYYIIYIFILGLHWNIFNGECIISYFEKKLLNNKYQLGDTDDLPFQKIIGRDTSNIFLGMNIISLLIILQRNYGNNYFKSMLVLSIGSIVLYYFSPKIKSKYNLNLTKK